MSEADRPSVTAVMIAWDAEPLLETAVTAALSSTDIDLDVVLVDNGCTTGAVDRLRSLDRVTVLSPGTNTGFARGCNLGAAEAAGEFLVFVNGDAVVEPTAIARLVAALEDDVALSTSSLRLYDDPDTMNSAGNPVHFSGLSWAGGLGDPASQHDRRRDVASASGATTAVRSDRFAELGGFCESMFAYCEDTDLSLRCWQRGWRVVYVPDAVVRHRYEFSRNERKLYLLERNRLFVVLTLYQARTLALLAPALALQEATILLVAVRQGWGLKKIAGWTWLWRNRRLVRSRRSEVQAARVLSDRQLSLVITGDFAPGVEVGMAAPGVVRVGSRAYWALVRRWLPQYSSRTDRADSAPAADSVPRRSAARADGADTAGSDYAERLRRRGGARWKRLVDVQRPYRWNLRRLHLGRVLDVGCGIGRNLAHLPPGSVGVDHNEVAVSMAREAGLSAYTTDEFRTSGLASAGAFDSILLAHVVEHVSAEVADDILEEYLPCLRAGGRVVLITPQEAGYSSDPTHVRFVDLEGLRRHAERHRLAVDRGYSFPFPRVLGRLFKYNEFVLVVSKTAGPESHGRTACVRTPPTSSDR